MRSRSGAVILVVLLAACGDRARDDAGRADSADSGAPDEVCLAPPSGLTAAPAREASTAEGVVSGTVEGLELGWAVAIGDLVEGGGNEMAIAAPSPWGEIAVGERGRVYVAEGLHNAEADELPSFEEPGWQMHSFGSALTVFPDPSRPGATRLAIGHRNAKEHIETGNSAGAVWLIDGPWPAGANPSLEDASATIMGVTASDLSASAAVGDIDGNGVPDIALGAPFRDGFRLPRIGLFPADVRGELSIEEAPLTIYGVEDDGTGFAVLPELDLQGDGAPDVVAPASPGDGYTTFMLFGPITADRLVTDADASFTLNIPNYRPGAADIDGDGSVDLIVGDHVHPGPYSDRDGLAWVLHGPIEGGDFDVDDVTTTIGPERAHDGMGTDFASLGDLDDDGFAELAVGAWGDSYFGDGPGKVYVFPGPLSGAVEPSQAALVLTGECVGDVFGFYIEAGDIDVDGVRDLVVSAVAHGSEVPGAGRVYLFDGSTLLP